MQKKNWFKILIPIGAVLLLYGGYRIGKRGLLFSGAGTGGFYTAGSAPTAKRSSAINDIAMNGAAAEAEPQANADAIQSQNGSSGTASAPVTVPENRKLVKTVNMSMETTEFDTLLKTVQDKVAEMGGYVENSNISGASLLDQNTLKPAARTASSGKRASITARIPADRLDSFVTVVGSEGNVTDKSENVSDVTLQYTDIESHKKSLKTEQERLWQLLSQAESTDAIVTIQSRLSEIEYQLDSYESQLRVYDNQVDYATVTIALREVKTYSAAEKEGIGTRMIRGIRSTLSGLRDFLINFAVGFVSFLPVLLLLLILFLIVRAIVRAVRKKVHQKAPVPATPGAATPGPTAPGAATPGPTAPGPTTPGPATPGAATPGPAAPDPLTPTRAPEGTQVRADISEKPADKDPHLPA